MVSRKDVRFQKIYYPHTLFQQELENKLYIVGHQQLPTTTKNLLKQLKIYDKNGGCFTHPIFHFKHKNV